MSYRVRFTPAADRDLLRLYDFILEMSDGNFALAERALAAIRDGVRMIEQSPFSCRRLTSEGALLRELLIPFGASGYLALFEIENSVTINVLAIRHQREDDYH